jgi:hypothetical protein
MGVRRDRTDADGAFRVRGISSTREQLLVAEHDARGRSLPVIIPPATTDASFELTLRGYGSLVGTVTLGGKGAEGLTVVATPKGATHHNLVVTTGPGGAYAFERIPAGVHQIMAMSSSGVGGGNAGSATATIRAGEESRVDVGIDVGDVVLAVAIAGVGGARIDAAQVFLFRGAAVAPKTGLEVNQAFLEHGSTAMVGMSMGGQPASFQHVVPDDYNVCVLPIGGDLNDPSFAMRLQEHAMSLKVYCQRHTVAAGPTQQSYTATVPPMEPLPDTPPPDPPSQ